MNVKLQAMCAQQVPGDTYRNLVINPSYAGRTFKHVLVPVWLLSYNYGAKAYQVIVNGSTGQIAGTRPYSAWKIFFAVVAAIIAAIVIAILSNR
jgi:hypothetical protein